MAAINSNLEERVSRLESEIESLKQEFVKSRNTTTWEQACGTFKHDPDFAEVLRLGREARNNFPDDTQA
jgi:hypothetical protein